MHEYKLFINGEYCDAASGKTFDALNPATGEPFARIALAGPEDVTRACESAQATFESKAWQAMPADERGQIIRKAAALMSDRADELARLETMDVGKTITDSTNLDLPLSSSWLDWYGTVTCSVEGETLPIPNPNQIDFTLREPYGVVGCIIPWNFPLYLAVLKVGPALAVGNTVVLKPAPWASVTSLLLGELFAEAGLPPGALNIITGDAESGEALCRDPRVQKLFFTGSTATGRRVLQLAAERICDTGVELGGKSPNLIFADADWDQAVAGATFGILLNNGQNCIAGSRLLVEAEIYEEFVVALAEKFNSLTVGDPMDPASQLGAIISAEQHDKIKRYIRAGVDDGATLVCGGGPPEGPTFAQGWWMEPTIFSHVTNDMTIAQEEIFGPVVCVIPFADEEEAIALANDTPYGLGSGVFTTDLAKANRVIRRLQAGTVYVNTYNQVYPQSPFPGWKQSGIGVERGLHGLLENTRLKNVIMDLTDEPIPWF